MNATEYAKQQCETSFGLLAAIAGGMDDASYNWKPGGTANPAGKTHVHALTSVDFFINVAARDQERLWTAFASKNGLPENPREMWSYEGTIPHGAVQEYAAELQKGVLHYVASLIDNDLDYEVETQFYGRKSIGFLVQFAATHAIAHGGEIAAVKGVQGLKGLPF